MSSFSSSFNFSFSLDFGSIIGGLNRWRDGRRQRHIPAMLDLSFSFLRVRFFHEPKMCELGNAQKLLNKTGNSQKVKGFAQLKGRAIPKIYIIWKNFSFHDPKTCTQSEGHKELHPGPIPNSNIYGNFIKIKFFNLNSNFDPATQKKFKKQSYMAKLIAIMQIIMASI